MKDDRQFPEPRESVGGFGWPEQELPHERDLAFFRSGSPDPIGTACRLARFYGCAPSELLKEDAAIIASIVAWTIVLMEEERADHV